jgi:CubicO group peptidase (beta-lactamase class C family)
VTGTVAFGAPGVVVLAPMTCQPTMAPTSASAPAISNQPGTRHRVGFEYQDGGPHLLSAVIEEITHQTTLDYARRVLFEPLGIQTRPAYQGSLFDINETKVEKIKTFGWLRDHEGIHCGSFGLKLTGRDLVKLGELYRQNGVYNGRRILDESFVSEATRAQSGDLPGFVRLPLVGHANRDDAGLQRHRTIRPAGPCGTKPRASGRHLQWLLSAVALAGRAAVDGPNGDPAPTAFRR